MITYLIEKRKFTPYKVIKYNVRFFIFHTFNIEKKSMSLLITNIKDNCITYNMHNVQLCIDLHMTYDMNEAEFVALQVAQCCFSRGKDETIK